MRLSTPGGGSGWWTSRREQSRRASEPDRAFAHLQSVEDVADMLEISASQLGYMLWRAPVEQRYRTFEIPKRTGGMRTIDAPLGLVREAQDKLAPMIAALYEPHPAAHGFLKERNILTNAEQHAGQRLVLNIDL